MPKIPRFDDLLKVNFVTNYFLQGCVPPFWLFIETAHEPAEALLLLLILPDLTDIGQALFSPGGRRKMRPGRHGRKSGRGIGFPDTSDMVGELLRAEINPHDALNFGPTRFAFKLLDGYEGVAFSAAVLEGVTDVGFGGLLGVLSLDRDNCPAMGFIQRRTLDTGEYILPVIGPLNPFNLAILEGHSHFDTWDGFGTSSAHGDFRGALAATAVGNVPSGSKGVQFFLLGAGNEVKAESSKRDLAPGEAGHFTCDAKFDRYEPCVWAGTADEGNTWCPEINFLGFNAKW